MDIVLWIIGGILTYGLNLAQFYVTCSEKVWNKEGMWKLAVVLSIMIGAGGWAMLFITLVFMLFAYLIDGDERYKYQGLRWWK